MVLLGNILSTFTKGLKGPKTMLNPHRRELLNLLPIFCWENYRLWVPAQTPPFPKGKLYTCSAFFCTTTVRLLPRPLNPLGNPSNMIGKTLVSMMMIVNLNCWSLMINNIVGYASKPWFTTNDSGCWLQLTFNPSIDPALVGGAAATCMRVTQTFGSTLFLQPTLEAVLYTLQSPLLFNQHDLLSTTIASSAILTSNYITINYDTHF